MWFKNVYRGHPFALCNYITTNWLLATVWFKSWKGETETRCGDLLNLLGSVRNESRILIGKRSPFEWVVRLIKRKSVRPYLTSSGHSDRRRGNFRSFLNLRSSGLCNSRVSRHCVCVCVRVRARACACVKVVKSLSCDVWSKEVKWRVLMCSALYREVSSLEALTLPLLRKIYHL